MDDNNPSGLSASTLRLDLDYIMHVEHEVPMEYFTKLEEMKDDIVKNMLVHANEAVARAERELRYAIARTMREEVTTISNHAMRVPAPRLNPNVPTEPEPYSVEDLMNG